MKNTGLIFGMWILAGLMTGQLLVGADRRNEPETPGIRPAADDGRVLNLDFETGDLQDWTAEGDAWVKQPVKGELDVLRGPAETKRAYPTGEYWVGGYEISGDAGQGVLTSVQFKVTHPWASFLMAGGDHQQTRVELVLLDDQKKETVIFQISGTNTEEFHPVVVNLGALVGRQIRIRLIDRVKGGWGHVNFDDFRLHAERPKFSRPELKPRSLSVQTEVYPYAGLTADEAARVMQVPPGFKVQVAAAEPDVAQPVAMCIDDRGRVWVAEAHTYPQRAEDGKGKDRILIFEDTDQNGTLDKRTVFVEGLNLVSGLEVGFGGVWVGAAPFLMFIPDANGNDIPDGLEAGADQANRLHPDVPPGAKILLEGWHYEDTHETLNAFIWGPDGWLYGCHGVFTHSAVGKPGTPADQRTRINAGVWRYHPLQHTFELFAEGTSNPWGVDFDENGQAFITACVIPHLYHMIEGGRYQRQAGTHFNPNTFDDIKTIARHRHYTGNQWNNNDRARSDDLGGGHAHAGAMIYLGGSWPATYHGKLFMHNIHGNRVNVDELIPQGSGYAGDRNPDFLLTGDKWSQMINLQYGPDGQVWMIDWYDANQCHRPEEGAHDRTNGRIFRVVYNDTKPVSVDLSKLSDLELARGVDHPNEWYIRHGRRLLQERAATRAIDADAVALLRNRLFIGTDVPVSRRLRALWTLAVVGDPVIREPRSVTALLKDESPSVRAWAVRLFGETPAVAVSDSLAAQLVELAKSDPSPVVRLALASLCGKLPAERRWDILAGLTSHAADAKDHNLPLMYWYAMEPLADVDPQRALALAISAGGQIPWLQDYMVRRLGSGDPSTTLQLLIGGLEAAQTDASRLTFLEGIHSALKGRRDLPESTVLSGLAVRFKDQAEPFVWVQANAISMRYQNPDAIKALLEGVSNSALPVEVRRTALKSLIEARNPDLAGVFQALMSDAVMRRDAIRACAAVENVTAAEQLVASYQQFTPEERRDALETLASRPVYASRLLTAVQAGTIARSELSADLVRQLRNLKDEDLARQLEQVWGVVRETAADRVALMAKYTALINRPEGPRDQELGRAIFAKTCQQCHVLYGTGGKVGPDLTGSNRTNTEYLLSNIVDPSAVMAKEYRPTAFALADGRVVTGIIRDESGPVYVVQTANELVTFPKDDVDERKDSDQSMMPDDQLKNFSEAEIRALVAYLQGSGQVPMKATPDNITGFFNKSDLTNWFSSSELLASSQGRSAPDGLSWMVENGELIGRSTKGLARNEFLVSQYQFEDFRFECEVKLVGNEGNSGIQFRSVPLADGEMRGYQADIGKGWWGKLYEESARGLVENNDAEKHAVPGEWNRYEIVAIGSRVRTWINGQLCVDRDDPAAARRGVIGLQLHSGGPTEVRFRNLAVELLEPNPARQRVQPAGAGSEVVVHGPGVSAVPGDSISFEKQVLDTVFRSEGAAIADFNNDGLRDVVAGSQLYLQSRSADGKSEWTPQLLLEKPAEFDPKVYSQSFMNWAEDLNGDGRLDLIVVDFPGTRTWWFENPGATAIGKGAWKRHEVTPVTNNESPQYEDVNGDGQRDLVLGFEPKVMGFASPKSFPEAVWKLSPVSLPGSPGTERFSHGVGLGDLNGDGRKDICITDGWWEHPADPSITPWQFHQADFGKACSQMYVVDLDGDGDNDILSASAHDFGIWWHENQGADDSGDLKWVTHEIDRSFSETHAVVLTDINGDGLPDFVTGKRWWSHAGKGPGGDQPAVLKWFELKRESVTTMVDGKSVTKMVPRWTAHEIDNDSGVGTQFDVADLNGDGLPDLAISNKKGTFVFLQKRK